MTCQRGRVAGPQVGNLVLRNGCNPCSDTQFNSKAESHKTPDIEEAFGQY